MNVVRHVEGAARRRGAAATALTFGGARWSYAEVDRLASQTAHVLTRRGVRRGDRVALYLPNGPEWVWGYLGALKLGAIPVSVPASWRAAEVGALVADAEPAVLLTDGERLHHLPPGAPHQDVAALDALRRDAPGDLPAAEMAPDDPAALVYTSGTTGLPKGVTLSHGNVVANAAAKVRYLGIREDDRLLLFLPLHHCFGQNAVLNAAFQAGATVVLQPRFDPELILAATRAGEVTMFFGIPASYVVLLERAGPADLSGVRYFFSAAAPLPLEVERRWGERFGAVIHQGYGLTETSPFASYNHHFHHRPGSVGTPIEGVEMKVVDPETGEEVAPGQPGEILIRGHNVMLGYWRQPEETARAIRDGWFRSGDIGRRDEDGYFYLHDRLKDVVNVGGLKVYPAEVDAVLSACPGVAEAAAYGAPDAVLGEQLRAAVVPRPGEAPAPEAILRFCRQRLADYKVPVAVELRTSIPRTPTGKVLRRVLRDEAGGHPGRAADAAGAAGPAGRGRDEVRAWIVRWLAARLGPAAETALRDPRASFADLGVSSVLAVQLARELGKRFGVALLPVALWSYPTLERLAGHVAGQVASGAPASPVAATAR